MAEEGHLQVFRKSAAREAEEEEAAAVTVWATSLTWRVEGSSIRSLVNSVDGVREGVVGGRDGGANFRLYRRLLEG